MITLIKKISITSFLLAVSLQVALAQSTAVAMDSGSWTLSNQADVILSGGSGALNGDGDVIQLGYYTGGTTGNPFAGTWTPITGEGQPNTAPIPGSVPPFNLNQTSIGDDTSQGGADGMFFIGGMLFTVGSPISGNNLPGSTSIPLVVRFYNGTTLANSTFYNAVSDSLWTWKTPNNPPPTVAMSFDDPNLQWLSLAMSLGGVNGLDAQTVIPFGMAPVPEVSTVACALLCAAGVGFHAFRRRRVVA